MTKSSQTATIGSVLVTIPARRTATAVATAIQAVHLKYRRPGLTGSLSLSRAVWQPHYPAQSQVAGLSSAASANIEHVFSPETTTSTCQFCGRHYLYDRRRGHTRKTCNSCRTNSRKSRRDLKIALTAIAGSSCEICGYSRCLRALGFHHLDPATKRFHIAGSHTRSWQSILDELQKCVLLCANCHIEVESGITDVPAEVRNRVEQALRGVERLERRGPGRPAAA
jgi:hypothetical protein